MDRTLIFRISQCVISAVFFILLCVFFHLQHFFLVLACAIVTFGIWLITLVDLCSYCTMKKMIRKFPLWLRIAFLYSLTFAIIAGLLGSLVKYVMGVVCLIFALLAMLIFLLEVLYLVMIDRIDRNKEVQANLCLCQDIARCSCKTKKGSECLLHSSPSCLSDAQIPRSVILRNISASILQKSMVGPCCRLPNMPIINPLPIEKPTEIKETQTDSYLLKRYLYERKTSPSNLEAINSNVNIESYEYKRTVYKKSPISVQKEQEVPARKSSSRDTLPNNFPSTSKTGEENPHRQIMISSAPASKENTYAKESKQKIKYKSIVPERTVKSASERAPGEFRIPIRYRCSKSCIPRCGLVRKDASTSITDVVEATTSTADLDPEPGTRLCPNCHAVKCYCHKPENIGKRSILKTEKPPNFIA